MANSVSVVDQLILRLFQCQKSFLTWIRLHDSDFNPSVSFFRLSQRIANPVYYASLLGLDQVLYKLVNDDTFELMGSKMINARGGNSGNVL